MRDLPPVEVLHRDEHFLVVAKPVGLSTTSPDGKDCLAWIVSERLDRGASHAHPSSRLDRDVTGVVVFARTDRGIQHLFAARAAGTYARSYRAIVSPAPEAAEGRWVWTLAVDPKNRRLRVALSEGEGGERAQAASTRFVRLAIAHGSALLELEPETGRTHQLRVHASRAGCPIAGDVDYRGVPRIALADGRVVAVPRVMLHCRHVTVPAIGGGTLALGAPVPPDFSGVWKKLGGEEEALVR